MPEEDPTPPAPLEADRLAWRCDPGQLGFETTDDLEELGEVFGQERAVEAVSFAIGMHRPGYNLYALGPEGVGRHTLLQRAFEAAAAEIGAPSDWCYVSNFGEPRKPLALSLPPGRGRAFRDDMARFVEDVRVGLLGAFESDDYRTRRQVIEEEFKERREQALSEVEREAEQHDIALLRTPIGFAFAPVREGRVVSGEEFKQLPEEERRQAESRIEALQEKLKAALEQAPAWMKQAQEKLRRLNDETATYAVGPLIDDLEARYRDLPAVVAFLEQVRRDAIDNVEAFVNPPERQQQQQQQQQPGQPAIGNGHPLLRRYSVNLLVHHEEGGKAPVVYEDDPTFDRLIGRIEHRAEMGALTTDFHMIRGGALHQANGGYLIIDAAKLLTRPMAYDALKRVLLSGKLRIESAAQSLGVVSTVTLEPEPIEVDVKIGLVGDRLVYYLLSAHDPEFSRLFKVAADFEERLERNERHSTLYARLVASIVKRDGLIRFDRGAVARVLEEAARDAGDGERLSTGLERLGDVLREADYHARRRGCSQVGAAEIQAALDSRERRQSRVRERIQEEIRRGTVVIDISGAVVGQINGLSVMQLGEYLFGRPSRITARVRLGKGEVIDIEREVALGGPLHAKGVLILAGYLGSHYASEEPLSLSASLVFEQSYGGVDGDSASSAELYALLSAIAEVPIRQGLAVTGSVDQRGRVQAIGGVNEKIEGFFDACHARGLSGGQGVLIPEANVKHLMVQRRVVEAVEAGQFHIYPVKRIEQGIEILTGMPAGVRGADGRFPEGTINARVEARLRALAERRRAFGAAGAEERAKDG